MSHHARSDHLLSDHKESVDPYMTVFKHLCDHRVANTEEANRLQLGGSFSSAASTSRSTKVNTCVLKSAPGLGVIGTRASFTESSSSERGAYIET